MRAPIAKIRISAGNPGWYDPLTNIHLTLIRPEAFVFEGQNVTNIKNAVAFKLVSVIEGDLDQAIKEVPVSNVVREVAPTEEKQTEVIESVKEEVTEVKEEKVEEVAEEKKKTTKKTTKKKTTKKSEVTE